MAHMPRATAAALLLLCLVVPTTLARRLREADSGAPEVVQALVDHVAGSELSASAADAATHAVSQLQAALAPLAQHAQDFIEAVAIPRRACAW